MMRLLLRSYDQIVLYVFFYSHLFFFLHFIPQLMPSTEIKYNTASDAEKPFQKIKHQYDYNKMLFMADGFILH